MVMVDDSHAVGFVGKHGRGSAEHCGVEGRVDIITGTLGKALGGASGGYTSGKREVVDWLRQRSRPYLFSNTLMPAIAGASLKVFEHDREGRCAARTALRQRRRASATAMTKLGFTLAGADHPIIPVMLGDAALAQEMAAKMLERGIYVIGFSFPGRAEGPGAHPHADVGRAFDRGYRPRGRGVRRGRPRTRRDRWHRMSNMMRALVKAKAEPGIWMEEVPVPEIGPNDVLIKVKKTAICGTDVHIYNWDQWAQKTVPVPMVTGHEFVGTVADFGAAVTEYKVGQRVSGEGHIVCGHCRNCRAGQRASLPQHARRRRQPAGRLRRISGDPAAQCRADPRRHAGRDRRDLRSARQCRAHRAVLRSRRRGRAGHRRRADRHHGRAGGAVRRRAQGRHHRHQPDAAGAGQEARRPARRRRVEGKAARRDARRSA